jgi:hypothetical protein
MPIFFNLFDYRRAYAFDLPLKKAVEQRLEPRAEPS